MSENTTFSSYSSCYVYENSEVIRMSLTASIRACEYVSGFKYARVLNIRKFLLMRWDTIMEGFWIFQDSKHARFLHMQALHKVLNIAK